MLNGLLSCNCKRVSIDLFRDIVCVEQMFVERNIKGIHLS